MVQVGGSAKVSVNSSSKIKDGNVTMTYVYFVRTSLNIICFYNLLTVWFLQFCKLVTDIQISASTRQWCGNHA